MIFAAAVTCARSCCDLQRARCEEQVLWSTWHFLFGSRRQLQNVAKCFRSNVFNSLVFFCANANRRRDAKLSTEAMTEMACFVMKRADSMRTVNKFKSWHARKDPTVPPHGDSKGVEGFRVLRRISVEEALCLAIHFARVRKVMRAFGEAKVQNAMPRHHRPLAQRLSGMCITAPIQLQTCYVDARETKRTAVLHTSGIDKI